MRTEKEFMPCIKSIRTRQRLVKTKSFLKEVWRLTPLSLFISIIARVAIVAATIGYIESFGELIWIIRLCLLLWCFLPFRSLFYDFYYLIFNLGYDWKLNKSSLKNSKVNKK